MDIPFKLLVKSYCHTFDLYVNLTLSFHPPGVFRLGPCSLKAVKEGDVDLSYDTPFVFAEVNADTDHWVTYNDGSVRKVYSEPQAVGWKTSTKAVGTFTRADVTNDYKYPEGDYNRLLICSGNLH